MKRKSFLVQHTISFDGDCSLPKLVDCLVNSLPGDLFKISKYYE